MNTNVNAISSGSNKKGLMAGLFVIMAIISLIIARKLGDKNIIINMMIMGLALFMILIAIVLAKNAALCQEKL